MLEFLLMIGTLATIYSFMVLSLNVSWGYTRLLNFGLVGLFATGSYATAILTAPAPSFGDVYTIGLGLPIPVGIIGGILVGGATAAVLGIIAIRLKGHYLAVSSFAFAELILIIAEQEKWLTGGYYGINTVPEIFGENTLAFLILTIGLLLSTLYILDKVLEWSPFGRVLRGVGDDEDAARMIGKNTNKLKIQSFIIAGAVAGLGGALYAHFLGSVVSTQFYAMMTWIAWTAMLVGGSGNNRAALIGSVVVIFGLTELVRLLPISTGSPTLFTAARSFLMGALLIAMMRWKPKGLFQEVV